MLLSDYTIKNTENKFKQSEYLDFFLKVDAGRVEDILKAFSFFLSSSKNYKYNITHITDQINIFKGKVDLFKDKKKLYESVIKRKSFLKNKNNECVMIVFDRCFLFDSNSPKVKFVENLSMFSVNDFSCKKICLQFKIRSIGEDLTEKEEEFSYALSYKSKEDMIHKGKDDIISKIKSTLSK